MISIVVPVLGRPANARPLLDSVEAATETPFELVWVVTEGDTEQHQACKATGRQVVLVPWKAGPGDFARKTNVGFGLTDGEWVFLGADDLHFHWGWDTEALKVATDTTAVIGTNDLGNPVVKAGKHSTHSLVRRKYVLEHGLTWDRKPGMVYSTAYDHQWTDTELVAVAIERDVFAFAKDSHVEHLHPLWNKSVMDGTYDKGMRRGREDQILFRKRRQELAA